MEVELVSADQSLEAVVVAMAKVWVAHLRTLQALVGYLEWELRQQEAWK